MLEHSLLSEAVFHQQAASGHAVLLTLPQVLARLSAEEDLTFTHLRPHQRPAWHAFLVQLAWLALENDDEPVQLPTGADAWAAKLRALTPGFTDDAPWCLLNTNWQQPAFLQAPCSKGREADFNKAAHCAQDIDLLVTSRHHDEKAGKAPITDEALDSLVYALVTLQGWASFMGAGNYNTMRMNGGFSSRPQFRLAFARGTGAEFVRDFRALLAAEDDWRHAAHDIGIGTGRAPHALLWLPLWDTGSLSLADVHPLCLEVTRRVRVVRGADHRLAVRRAGSDAARVATKAQAGVVADPWIPVMRDKTTRALTAQSHTLGYRSLQTLLFDRAKVALPLLAQPSPAERRSAQSGTLVAQVLLSGDGRTDGLAVREVLLPPKVLIQFAGAPERLAQRAQAFVEQASTASGKVYRSALIQYMDGSDDVGWKNRDFDKATGPWVQRFDQAIDDAFFSELFASVETVNDDTVALARWAQWLEAAAWAHLALATEALPSRDGQRWFARARAERFMRLALHKHFAPLHAAVRGSNGADAPIPDAEDKVLDEH